MQAFLKGGQSRTHSSRPSHSTRDSRGKNPKTEKHDDRIRVTIPGFISQYGKRAATGSPENSLYTRFVNLSVAATDTIPKRLESDTRTYRGLEEQLAQCDRRLAQHHEKLGGFGKMSQDNHALILQKHELVQEEEKFKKKIGYTDVVEQINSYKDERDDNKHDRRSREKALDSYGRKYKRGDIKSKSEYRGLCRTAEEKIKEFDETIETIDTEIATLQQRKDTLGEQLKPYDEKFKALDDQLSAAGISRDTELKVRDVLEDIGKAQKARDTIQGQIRTMDNTPVPLAEDGKLAAREFAQSPARLNDLLATIRTQLAELEQQVLDKIAPSDSDTEESENEPPTPSKPERRDSLPPEKKTPAATGKTVRPMQTRPSRSAAKATPASTRPPQDDDTRSIRSSAETRKKPPGAFTNWMLGGAAAQPRKSATKSGKPASHRDATVPEEEPSVATPVPEPAQARPSTSKSTSVAAAKASVPVTAPAPDVADVPVAKKTPASATKPTSLPVEPAASAPAAKPVPAVRQATVEDDDSDDDSVSDSDSDESDEEDAVPPARSQPVAPVPVVAAPPAKVAPQPVTTASPIKPVSTSSTTAVPATPASKTVVPVTTPKPEAVAATRLTPAAKTTPTVTTATTASKTPASTTTASTKSTTTATASQPVVPVTAVPPSTTGQARPTPTPPVPRQQAAVSSTNTAPLKPPATATVAATSNIATPSRPVTTVKPADTPAAAKQSRPTVVAVSTQPKTPPTTAAPKLPTTPLVKEPAPLPVPAPTTVTTKVATDAVKPGRPTAAATGTPASAPKDTTSKPAVPSPATTATKAATPVASVIQATDRRPTPTVVPPTVAVKEEAGKTVKAPSETPVQKKTTATAAPAAAPVEAVPDWRNIPAVPVAVVKEQAEPDKKPAASSATTTQKKVATPTPQAPPVADWRNTPAVPVATGKAPTISGEGSDPVPVTATPEQAAKPTVDWRNTPAVPVTTTKDQDSARPPIPQTGRQPAPAKPVDAPATDNPIAPRTSTASSYPNVAGKKESFNSGASAARATTSATPVTTAADDSTRPSTAQAERRPAAARPVDAPATVNPVAPRTSTASSYPNVAGKKESFNPAASTPKASTEQSTTASSTAPAVATQAPSPSAYPSISGVKEYVGRAPAVKSTAAASQPSAPGPTAAPSTPVRSSYPNVSGVKEQVRPTPVAKGDEDTPRSSAYASVSTGTKEDAGRAAAPESAPGPDASKAPPILRRPFNTLPEKFKHRIIGKTHIEAHHIDLSGKTHANLLYLVVAPPQDSEPVTVSITGYPRLAIPDDGNYYIIQVSRPEEAQEQEEARARKNDQARTRPKTESRKPARSGTWESSKTSSSRRPYVEEYSDEERTVPRARTWESSKTSSSRRPYIEDYSDEETTVPRARTWESSKTSSSRRPYVEDYSDEETTAPRASRPRDYDPWDERDNPSVPAGRRYYGDDSWDEEEIEIPRPSYSTRASDRDYRRGFEDSSPFAQRPRDPMFDPTNPFSPNYDDGRDAYGNRYEQAPPPPPPPPFGAGMFNQAPPFPDYFNAPPPPPPGFGPGGMPQFSNFGPPPPFPGGGFPPFPPPPPFGNSNFPPPPGFGFGGVPPGGVPPRASTWDGAQGSAPFTNLPPRAQTFPTAPVEEAIQIQATPVVFVAKSGGATLDPTYLADKDWEEKKKQNPKYAEDLPKPTMKKTKDLLTVLEAALTNAQLGELGQELRIFGLGLYDQLDKAPTLNRAFNTYVDALFAKSKKDKPKEYIGLTTAELATRRDAFYKTTLASDAGSTVMSYLGQKYKDVFFTDVANSEIRLHVSRLQQMLNSKYPATT